jgi:hypothetical protein
MAQELDVYRQWLGITETQRPLNYYQLLRLKTFEEDVAKIRAHYRKLNAHVRKFAAGDYAETSQDLLNELARAMLCLTDAQRKREYDVTLGRKEAGVAGRRSLEEILLSNRDVDQAQLEKARRFADQVGLEIRDALVQQKLAAPDTVMLAYAESQGLPYVELEEVGVDEELVPQIPSTTAKQHSCIPIMADGGQVLMASPNPLVPDVEEELRLRLGMPVRTVLCTPASINRMIAKHYGRDAQRPAAVAGAEEQRAARKAAKAAQKAARRAARAEAEPPSEEERRERSKYAVMAFCIGVTLGMIVLKIALGFGYLPALLLSALLGAVAAGATYFVVTKTGS